MKPIIINAVMLALLLTTATSIGQSNATINNANVIRLSEAGLSVDIILSLLQKAESTEFDISTEGLIALSVAGVENEVIQEMIRQGWRGGGSGSRSERRKRRPKRKRK